MARIEAVSPGSVILFMTICPPIALSIWLSEAFVSPDGWAALRLGTDFVPMWLSGDLYRDGRAAMLFDSAAMAERQAAYTSADGVLLWHYPPTYFLLVQPLHLLPFHAALAVFSAFSVVIWVVVSAFYRPVRGWIGILFLYASPVVAVCLLQGQNGLMTAGLLGAALLARAAGRRWLAALMIALLLTKPHLGLAVSIVLIAARDYRFIGSIAMFGLAFIGITFVTFGTDLWLAFFRNGETIRVAMTSGDLWSQQPSIYALLSLLGAEHNLSLTGQAVISLAAATWLWRVWRSACPATLRGSALLSATLLLTPFCFRYDMGVSLLGLALLTRHLADQGWLRGDRVVLAGLWIAPAIMPAIADATSIQIGTVALLVQSLLIQREITRHGAAADGSNEKGGACDPPFPQ